MRSWPTLLNPHCRRLILRLQMVGLMYLTIYFLDAGVFPSDHAQTFRLSKLPIVSRTVRKNPRRQMLGQFSANKRRRIVVLLLRDTSYDVFIFCPPTGRQVGARVSFAHVPDLLNPRSPSYFMQEPVRRSDNIDNYCALAPPVGPVFLTLQ